MKKTTIIAVILAVLLVFSVVQAFQLNTLKDKVSGGGLTIGSASVSTPSASSSGSGSTGSLPSSIKNLPTMVGGC